MREAEAVCVRLVFLFAVSLGETPPRVSLLPVQAEPVTIAKQRVIINISLGERKSVSERPSFVLVLQLSFAKTIEKKIIEIHYL